MKMPNLGEKQYGRKILVGVLAPIVMMASNAVFCLICDNTTPLALVRSMFVMLICFGTVCCFQIEYTSILMVIFEAVPTAIFFTIDAPLSDVKISGALMIFIILFNLFSLELYFILR